MNKSSFVLIFLVVLFSIYFIVSCTEKNTSPKVKYEMYCGSCHLLPNLKNIPKAIWENNVLPEMAARMGYRYNGFNPYKNSMEENYLVRLSNTYPETSIIDSVDWQEIHDYVLSQAPDEVSNNPTREGRNFELKQFSATQHILNQNLSPSGVTFIQFDSLTNRLFLGNHYGQFFEWGQDLLFERRATSPVVSCILDADSFYLTEIGIMNPSEIPRGAIYKLKSDTVELLYQNLHRPVYTELEDLNSDGTKEILVCEFGYHTGELSLLVKKDSVYMKKTLVPLPGSIKVEVSDLNSDGKKEIVVLFSQGKEGIYILYQKDDFTFELDYVIEMQPEYGLSWFELVDYNKDGHLDIIAVNGDNADYSIFLKPYHGIRLFLNDGKNNFEEKWFYPINGATRLLAEDFDLDGDIDFAVLSFFPDFINIAEEGFVYLENLNSTNFKFKPYTTDKAKEGNWLIMEKGDFDKDGDIDIILGNYPLLTTNKVVKSNKFDVLYLENNAIEK